MLDRGIETHVKFNLIITLGKKIYDSVLEGIFIK